jgi:hypothetical protein
MKLITLNLNSAMAPCFRESLRAAANRWGGEYVEITEPTLAGDISPVWQKAALHRHVADGETVIQIDADVLIRFDCPSPIGFWDGESFAAAEFAGYYWCLRGMTPLVRAGCELSAGEIRQCDATAILRGWFNPGLMVYRTIPEHRAIFEDAIGMGVRVGFENFGHDEPAINAARYLRGIQPQRLPVDFNPVHVKPPTDGIMTDLVSLLSG